MSNSSSMKKVFGILFLSLLFALGMSLNFFACLSYENWWPLVILLFWFMIPLQAFLWVPPKNRWNEDPVTDNCADVAFFMTGALLTSGLWIPVILTKYGYLEMGAAYMSFGGCIAFCAAAIVFAKVSLGAWRSTGSF